MELRIEKDIEVVGDDGWKNTIDSKKVLVTDNDHLCLFILVCKAERRGGMRPLI